MSFGTSWSRPCGGKQLVPGLTVRWITPILWLDRMVYTNWRNQQCQMPRPRHLARLRTRTVPRRQRQGRMALCHRDGGDRRGLSRLPARPARKPRIGHARPAFDRRGTRPGSRHTAAMTHVLAIDQGTSGTKAIVVDPDEGVVDLAEVPVHPKLSPRRRRRAGSRRTVGIGAQRGPPRPRPSRAAHPRDVAGQPGRDGTGLGPGHREAAHRRHRVAGPSRRNALRCSG